MGDYLRTRANPEQGVNMALVVDWLEFERNGDKGIELCMASGKTIYYYGDERERVLAWLRENGDLPVVAPG